MITLISFILLILGALNWLFIGLMQYDFVAGFFGTQSSFLSRAIYIIIGFAAIWLVFSAFKQKGRIKLNDNGFKKHREQTTNPAPSNVELDQEIHKANQTHNPFDNQ